jgi:hypothetical protein
LLLIIGAVLAFLVFAAPDQLAQGLSSLGIDLFAPPPVATQAGPPATTAAVEPTAVSPTEANAVVIVALTDIPTDTPIPVPSPEQTEPALEEERLPTVTRGAVQSPTAPPTVTPTPIPTPIPPPTVVTATLITQTGTFTQVDVTELPEPELILPLSFEEDPTQHNGGRGVQFIWHWPGEFTDNLSFQIRMYLPDGEFAGIHDATELRNEGRFEQLDNDTYALTVVLDGVGNITQSGSNYRWTVALVQIEPDYEWLNVESERRRISILVPQN